MSKIPAIVWLPLAFVVGGVVGYWNNAEDVRLYKEKAAAAEKQADTGKKGGGDGFGSFAQMMQIPKEAKRPQRRKSADGGQTNEVAVAKAEGAKDAKEEPASQENFNPEDLRARIDEAADLWRTRIEVAKAAAVEKLGLDAAGQQKFEASLVAMNDRIRESIQTIADALANEEKMTHETNVRLMGDLATSIAEAYDDVGECVDASRRGDVSEMMLFEFIDPSVAEPLIAVQDKLEGMGPMGGGRKRR